MTRLKTAIVIGLLNGLLGALFFLTPWAVRLEENYGLGWLFQARGPLPPPEEVVLVTMDTESMKALGLERLHRKWPRELHAQLIERLSAAGARLIAFDIYFREEREPDADATLARAMRQAGNVLLVQEVRKDAYAVAGDAAAAFTETLLDPIPPLRDAAVALAPFTLPGVPVKVSQFWRFKPETGDTPTLPTVAFEYYARQGGDARHQAALEALHDGTHSQYLNYYGPPRSIQSISYHRMLTMSAEELTRLRGKAVFVGVSEAFQWDQTDTFYTVYSDSETGHNISGVEIAATAFANLLQRNAIVPLSQGQALTLLLLWGVLLGFLARVLPAVRAVFATVVLMLLYVLLAHRRFEEAHQWLPLVVPALLQTLPVLFVGTLLSYREAHSARAHITATLRRYLPPQVVEEAASAIRRIGGPGKTAYGVCLSTDAEQYTRMAEQLAPEQLRGFLNAYYETLFAVVHHHGGIVSDVVGDAVLALWVEPASPAAARALACQAALDIKTAVEAFNRSHADFRLPIRIGVHCGPLYIGDVGAGEHYEYRAVGDTVNTAARIEQANKVLGTRLLVSEEGLEEVEAVRARELGVFRLPGKTQAVRLFELVGRASVQLASVQVPMAAFAEALTLFRERQWEIAYERFAAMLQQTPDDGPARLYLKLCEQYRREPPAESWDGVIDLAGK